MKNVYHPFPPLSSDGSRAGVSLHSLALNTCRDKRTRLRDPLPAYLHKRLERPLRSAYGDRGGWWCLQCMADPDLDVTNMIMRKTCHRIRHYEKTKERVKKRLKSVPQVLTCTRCPLLAVILVMFSPFPRRFVFCLAGGYGLFALSISGS